MVEQFKRDFVKFLLSTQPDPSLRVFDKSSDDRTLKSKRISPWFVNIGDFNDGASLGPLSNHYADALLNSGADFDLVYGIPEKGNLIAPAVVVGLAGKGKNVPVFATRKVPKEHGEASNLSSAERIKAEVVGRVPKSGQRIAQLDDVFTAGDAKYEARGKLEEIGKLVGGEFEYPVLAIAVDRMEVAIDSKNAIAEYEQKTGTRVVSIVNALDVIDVLREEKLAPERALERLSNYLRVYGTEAARKGIVERFGKLEQKIINRDRSVIPACDVATIEEFEKLVEATAPVEGIGGYKIGFELGYLGLAKVVETARKHTDKPIIFDHQKAGTDIPDTGRNFARVMKDSGVDAVILFPQAGPETERAWIYHALDAGLKVIVGGRMTHPAYAVSEGGFITDEGALDMYRIAARAGVSNFVVPGNKIEVIKQVRDVVEAEGVIGKYMAPGFITQGGKIEDGARAAGDYCHAIVGRGITQAKDMKAAAIEHCSQL